MTPHEKIQRGYMISTRGPDSAGLFRVYYVPRGLHQPKTSGKTKKIPEFVATVNVPSELVQWENKPTDHEADIDADARQRGKVVYDWLKLVTELIDSVEEWAADFGWSPKRIDKPMEDSEVGKHSVPALLLQKESTKALLEPIARRAPGTEGVVDLYLMPGYDDIASLYHYNHRWNLHYQLGDQNTIANLREAEAKPLTKANFKRVLEELKANAQ